MSLSSSISRLTVYLRRNGARATVRRAQLALERVCFSNRMVLFYCDISTLRSAIDEVPDHIRIERHTSPTNINPRDLEVITSFWNPKLATRNIKQRFELGASLWLIRSKDTLAGYGWTLQKRTVELHYFPLGLDDVHLFDFQVFPQYRGRGLNPLLVNHILRNLSSECKGRAFIEAAEWNQAQLSSLQKTGFRRLDSARKLSFFGRTIVFWDRKSAQSEGTLELASSLPQNHKASSLADVQQ
ncbi:MAG TPA: GNAT family N-acetyltransferase [Terriglobales bacterium]|nr:GNAT family N-acetyltransferase [Terriglobales bacterium]